MYYYIRKKKYDIFDIIGKFLGNVIMKFVGQHHGDINKTKKISFDIRARVGDAVVNKPLIIMFSKYLREQLGLHIEILVETSEYNDFVFRDENLGKYYIIQKFQNEKDEHVTLGKYIKSWLSVFKSKKYIKNNSFVYVSSKPKHIIENEGVAISYNIYLDNYLLDFMLNPSIKPIHVLNTTIELLVNYFQIPEFWDYVNDNLDIFYSDYNKSDKSGIMIFVGNKEFRNLTILKRYNLISGISECYKKEKIVVIDDNTNFLYERLQKYEYLGNVHFVKNSFSIDEFKNYAKNFKLIIGGDGGGFNYIRIVTNSIGIYTVANPKLWRVYSGLNEYSEKKILNNYFWGDYTFEGKMYGYIYKKSKILPSYDYSVGNNYFDDLPVDNLAKLVKNYI